MGQISSDNINNNSNERSRHKTKTNEHEREYSYRTEHDTLGEVKVRSDRYWGAQTERSRQNFRIGSGIETIPSEIIKAFAYLKKACALANHELLPGRMTSEKLDIISRVCDEILAGELDEHFPLVVWQTGSGTQSNMNINEVIANRGNELAGKELLHPNDDANMSQSSNDTFPAAMYIAGVLEIRSRLIPSVKNLIKTFTRLESENQDIIKTGRTHLMDAAPLRFSQEISGWRSSLEVDAEAITQSLAFLNRLAIGGTAVGTGLNAPAEFDDAVSRELTRLTGQEFTPAENKFHALTSKSEMVVAHGAVKALAADMMKIANDVRLLASGPRCGLGEITIPENEPGSSIMPGKVNPTQCEQVAMVAVQVMSNDVAVSLAASQGNFELNVFMPVCAYNFLQSVRLLAESITSFDTHCASGIKANRDKMHENLTRSLMLVTALNPVIGYENAARVAKLAHERNISLSEACSELGLLSPDKFKEVVDPEKMV